jgi:hypothetical protein
MQVGPRQAVAMNLAADRGGLAERGVHFLPVDVGGPGAVPLQGEPERDESNGAFHASSPCFAPFP